ncbi:hypothetical protein V5E97_04430 [Singulisphaera sp. Ch08]|uniref:Uncharacterized protein n=1 Tax=Singulisphaera sp. Ch08 TaxID=3120278 RepID=A0AAU7CII5_9BACT
MNARRAMAGLVVAICAVVMAARATAVGEADELEGLKQAKAEVARKYLAGVEEVIMDPAGDKARLPKDIAELADWSKRSMESQLDLSDAPGERDAVIKAHVDRLEKWLEIMRRLQKADNLDTPR